MVHTIKIDFEVLEMMLFYWEGVAAKDKIGDDYFISIAEKPQMTPLYTSEFTHDSVRKVLSAISNRELLNERTHAESRFWNNNMWMLEDLNTMRAMLAPIKKLNLDELKKMNSNLTKYTEISVVFIPGHFDETYTKDNTLYINFFKIMVDPTNYAMVTINGIVLKDYVLQKVQELL